MKKLSVALFLLIGCLCFAQEYDDLDSLFGEESDVVVEAVQEEVKPDSDTGTTASNFSFSGNLNSKIGAGYQYNSAADPKMHNAFGYLSFTNTLDFAFFPIRDFSLKTTLKTELDSLTSDVKPFTLSQMYFDYLLGNMLYITCGKKYTSWTYSRLFKDADSLSSDGSFTVLNYDNVLFDSGSGAQFMLRLPVNNGTITGLILYKGSSTQPSMNDVSYAGSVEFTLFKTAVNYYARKTPPADPYVLNGQLSAYMEGIDIKHTFWDVDAYGQMQIAWKGFQHSCSYITDFDPDHIQSLTATAGCYYLWDKTDPNFGFNVEYQYTFNNNPGAANRSEHAVAFDAGIKRLGANKNIKLGFEGRLNVTAVNGYAKAGLIVANVFPNIDWENGLKYDFEKTAADGFNHKLTAGTFFTLHVNY